MLKVGFNSWELAHSLAKLFEVLKASVRFGILTVFPHLCVTAFVQNTLSHISMMHVQTFRSPAVNIRHKRTKRRTGLTTNFIGLHHFAHCLLKAFTKHARGDL